MKLLLIAPTALDYQGRPIKQKKLHLPGLTLPVLAAQTPPDVDITFVYETVQSIPYDGDWDLVGLTGMGSGVIRAWQIGDEFRKRGVKVVIGGIASSLGRVEWTLKHADTAIRGEAEKIWPTVIDDFKAGQMKQIYESPGPTPLETLPPPRLDLLPRSELGFWRPVQATRGCPYKCNFCSVTSFFGHRYRKKPISMVLRDIRAAKATGSRNIAFIDDNIGADFEYSQELWEALIPEKITWISQCSLRIADRPDLLELAHRSGCRLLSFGIESVNEASLKNINKPRNQPEQYRDDINTIRGHGIDVSTEMMIGIDGDDETVFDRTFDFLMDNEITTPRIHIITPIPGTPIFEDLEREGRIIHTDFERYSGGQVVYRPNGISPERLQDGYWELYKKLFTMSGIYKRCRKNNASLGPFMRAFVLGINFHYRHHVKNKICPGIV